MFRTLLPGDLKMKIEKNIEEINEYNIKNIILDEINNVIFYEKDKKMKVCCVGEEIWESGHRLIPNHMQNIYESFQFDYDTKKYEFCENFKSYKSDAKSLIKMTLNSDLFFTYYNSRLKIEFYRELGFFKGHNKETGELEDCSVYSWGVYELENKEWEPLYYSHLNWPETKITSFQSEEEIINKIKNRIDRKKIILLENENEEEKRRRYYEKEFKKKYYKNGHFSSRNT